MLYFSIVFFLRKITGRYVKKKLAQPIAQQIDMHVPCPVSVAIPYATHGAHMVASVPEANIEVGHSQNHCQLLSQSQLLRVLLSPPTPHPQLFFLK